MLVVSARKLNSQILATYSSNVISVFHCTCHRKNHTEGGIWPWFLPPIPSACALSQEHSTPNIFRHCLIHKRWWHWLFQHSCILGCFLWVNFCMIWSIAMVQFIRGLESFLCNRKRRSQEVWWQWQLLREQILLWTAAIQMWAQPSWFILDWVPAVEWLVQWAKNANCKGSLHVVNDITNCHWPKDPEEEKVISVLKHWIAYCPSHLRGPGGGWYTINAYCQTMGAVNSRCRERCKSRNGDVWTDAGWL